MNRPLQGGRYIRDAQTGKLIKADNAKPEPAIDGAEAPEPMSEPAKKGK